ncbi:hypothetical protein [Leifsonia sp. TF02-11]|uniref:hypothetical protein n=1 Tax=Leifsonia sp. TF02-11 TaxID=2815212 RepID=UPI001AA1B9FC|nr:hypothetical protein [Leifsonia sp. TF02-11]MBO1740478.1 hypothetical protein [Leifsonia sp. TF02-11]
MPRLVAFAQTELTTDFAILRVSQPERDDVLGFSFATTASGVISLGPGNKNSRVSVRVERWDSRPPTLDGWEDLDDMPFLEVPGAGPLVIAGFDPGETSLEIDGLGQSRVQVYANGRHRYHYGSPVDVDTLPPEQWLLRLYPSDDADPLVGGPRRNAGDGGLRSLPTNLWNAVLRNLRSTGWSDLLFQSAFGTLEQALWSAGGPVPRSELAALMVGHMRPGKKGGLDSESRWLGYAPVRHEEPDVLASLTGRHFTVTVGDAIDAVLELGLLLIERRGGEQLLLINPAPEPAWERIEMSGERLRHARLRAGRDHDEIATDLIAAIAWCGEAGLTATPRQMAIRWAASVNEVVGGLRILGGGGQLEPGNNIEFDSEFDPDEPLTLRRKSTS